MRALHYLSPCMALVSMQVMRHDARRHEARFLPWAAGGSVEGRARVVSRMSHSRRSGRGRSARLAAGMSSLQRGQAIDGRSHPTRRTPCRTDNKTSSTAHLGKRASVCAFCRLTAASAQGGRFITPAGSSRTSSTIHPFPPPTHMLLLAWVAAP